MSRSAGAGDESAVAREIADAAGELLLEVRHGLAAGLDPDAVRAEGDRRAHELILSLLASAFPADAVLSEESSERVQAAPSGRAWIVDPLDGTREFGEPGRSDWAVHVAFVAGRRLSAGAVALPARSVETLATDRVPALPPAVERPPRLAVSRTRPAREASELAERLGGELVPLGSAGVKITAVLTGEVDIYVHSGGQYVWDSAAPVAVARAAGLHASRIDGAPLEYDISQTWLPDLLVCREELRDRVLAELEQI